VQEASTSTDLLALIGSAIELLRKSIVMFEASKTADGIESISTVVAQIDGYLEGADEDPILRLAALPPAHVRSGLTTIQEELAAVIDELKPQQQHDDL